MRDLDLKTLRLLVAVCDHQNMARAAEQEHIEPSAISKRIAQLEADLGTPLLVRGRRGVQPTPAGLALLEHARNVLFTMDRIASRRRRVRQRHQGPRAAAGEQCRRSPSRCSTTWRRSCASRRNRNIKIDIEERLSSDLVRQVREGSASVGVCWDNVDFEGLQHRPYRSDRLALAVHPEHPLARRKSLRFEQTLDYEHVGLHASTAVHTMLQRAAARLGRTVTYRVVVSSFDAALRVVREAGHRRRADAAQPDLCVRRRVRMIPLTDPWARRRFAVCFRAFESLQPAARRMVEFLTACAASA